MNVGKRWYAMGFTATSAGIIGLSIMLILSLSFTFRCQGCLWVDEENEEHAETKTPASGIDGQSQEV